MVISSHKLAKIIVQLKLVAKIIVQPKSVAKKYNEKLHISISGVNSLFQVITKP